MVGLQLKFLEVVMVVPEYNGMGRLDSYSDLYMPANFWLASQYPNDASTQLCVYYSNPYWQLGQAGNAESVTLGIRPLICLDSDVEVTKVNGVWQIK